AADVARCDRQMTAYGQRKPLRVPRQPIDKRYGTRRWKRVREQVLRRDLERCQIVPGCQRTATVADHIEPATPEMPDALFFDTRNLRAACAPHNLSRGVMLGQGVFLSGATEHE